MLTHGDMFEPCGRIAGHTGKDALPHLEFWESVPGLVMDGIKFTVDNAQIAFEKFQSWRANR